MIFYKTYQREKEIYLQPGAPPVEKSIADEFFTPDGKPRWAVIIIRLASFVGRVVVILIQKGIIK